MGDVGRRAVLNAAWAAPVVVAVAAAPAAAASGVAGAVLSYVGLVDGQFVYSVSARSDAGVGAGWEYDVEVRIPGAFYTGGGSGTLDSGGQAVFTLDQNTVDTFDAVRVRAFVPSGGYELSNALTLPPPPPPPGAELRYIGPDAGRYRFEISAREQSGVAAGRNFDVEIHIPDAFYVGDSSGVLGSDGKAQFSLSQNTIDFYDAVRVRVFVPEVGYYLTDPMALPPS